MPHPSEEDEEKATEVARIGRKLKMLLQSTAPLLPWYTSCTPLKSAWDEPQKTEWQVTDGGSSRRNYGLVCLFPACLSRGLAVCACVYDCSFYALCTEVYCAHTLSPAGSLPVETRLTMARLGAPFHPHHHSVPKCSTLLPVSQVRGKSQTANQSKQYRARVTNPLAWSKEEP